jgi:hypothetical protein
MKIEYFNNGYAFVKAPGHPEANKCGLVREHILIAELVLGKFLPIAAIVHHINGKREDNRNCNLVVCHDISYHILIHKRARALAKCGHADWLKCCYCNEYDDPRNLRIGTQTKKNPYGNSFHKNCRNEYQKAYRFKTKNH